MNDRESIPALVTAMSGMFPIQRRQKLQELTGSRSENPLVLHWRALFYSALREANLWPIGGAS